MSKKIEVDTWVICPECKIKLKQQNFTYHMKHVHNKKIDDTEIKPLETFHKKRQENKTPKVISKMTLAVIIIIFIVAAASISIYFLFYSKDQTYTKTFSNLTPKEAYNLINTTENLTVIDCRGLEGCSTCQFNKGHLPGAIMNQNPTTLYQNESDYQNKTDILVYSKNGTVGADFCSDLVGHVYGKIYNLVGGYEAWAAVGYPNK